MNLVNLFLLVSAFQGLLLSLIILFSPFFKSRANKYLGYTIAVLSVLMFNIFLSNIQFFDSNLKWSVFNTIEWVFLFPVVFLRYILIPTNHWLAHSKKLYWLYLPIVLSIVLHVCIHLWLDFKWYQVTNKAVISFFDITIGLETLSTYAFTIVLLVWSRNVLSKAPEQDSYHIHWLKRLWLLVCIMVLSWVALFIVDVFLLDLIPQLDHYFINDQYILAIELCIFVYWVAYTGFYKLKLANDRAEILAILNSANTSKIETLEAVQEKTPNLLTTSDGFTENNRHFKALQRLLNEQHIYRNPDLSREDVAEQLGISAGYLSQIVNAVTQKNFTSYINSFRVEATKRMILDELFNKYSLLSIGLESGFNSKTTFYSAFKKETGCTPSAFKNQHK